MPVEMVGVILVLVATAGEMVINSNESWKVPKFQQREDRSLPGKGSVVLQYCRRSMLFGRPVLIFRDFTTMVVGG
jgi:hypothetical protein